MGNAVILFDDACLLCNRAARFIIVRDPRAYFRFASFDSATARELGERMPDEGGGTIVLWEDGVRYVRSAAVLRILGRLGAPWSLSCGFSIIPLPVRDALYGIIARNRYRWFGRVEACAPASENERARFIG